MMSFCKGDGQAAVRCARAGLAYRVSTKGQVDHDDIPMQKIECRKFCAQHGWRMVLEKAEKGVSGSKVSATKRDAIQELKAEAEKGTLTSCWYSSSTALAALKVKHHM